MTAMDTLKAAAAKQSTETLMGALALLDAKPTLEEHERMVHSAMADVVTEREGIDDLLDVIFDEHFTGSYFDAMLAAIALRDSGVTA